jgi:hypothetical protein
MGKIRTPEPGMVVVGVLQSPRDPVLALALPRLIRLLGEVKKEPLEFSFDWTDYYAREMGDPLTRSFVYGTRLASRDALVRIKLATNEIEDALARADGTRRINLDPGIMSPENFVLATTKNHAHRIYLGEGIFAEVTLRYRKNGFEPLDWTYPDYRSEQIREALNRLRAEYMGWLRSPSPPPTLEELP